MLTKMFVACDSFLAYITHFGAAFGAFHLVAAVVLHKLESASIAHTNRDARHLIRYELNETGRSELRGPCIIQARPGPIICHLRHLELIDLIRKGLCSVVISRDVVCFFPAETAEKNGATWIPAAKVC